MVETLTVQSSWRCTESESSTVALSVGFVSMLPSVMERSIFHSSYAMKLSTIAIKTSNFRSETESDKKPKSRIIIQCDSRVIDDGKVIVIEDLFVGYGSRVGLHSYLSLRA